MFINRRQFVKTTGVVAAVTLLGMDKVANLANVDDNRKNITRSIHANFGSGFTVVEHCQHKGKTIVEIEHLENQFIVESADLSEWDIVSSTVS